MLGRLSAVQVSSEIENLEFTVKCKEEFVFETEKLYVAMIEDKKFNSVEFLIGKPYIHKDSTGETSYGWTFDGNTEFIENAYKPCNPCWDDKLVIAFCEYTP